MVSTGGKYYLGLDIGSLSTKCVVIDAERGDCTDACDGNGGAVRGGQDVRL